MKKLLCVVLALLMMVSVLALVSCGNTTTPATDDKTPDQTTPETPATLKFGMGVVASTSKIKDAEPADEVEGTKAVNGSCEVDSTVAVITVDADGKIVACKIDVAQIQGGWTADGTANATTEFRTKGEKGDAYAMKGSSSISKEWFEQAAAFEAYVLGKTLDEVKASVGEDNLHLIEDDKAGCTIKINEFVAAIEKAFANLADSNATADSTLKLGMASEQAKQENAVAATEGVEAKLGTIEFDTTIFGAAVDADGKIVAVDTDCTQVTFNFDADGAAKSTAGEVLTKRQKGDDYNMVKFGGATKEWYQQADAFETQCIGKTAAEIAGLVGADGLHFTDDVKETSGCTIKINGFVAAVAKIAPAAE